MKAQQLEQKLKMIKTTEIELVEDADTMRFDEILDETNQTLLEINEMIKSISSHLDEILGEDDPAKTKKIGEAVDSITKLMTIKQKYLSTISDTVTKRKKKESIPNLASTETGMTSEELKEYIRKNNKPENDLF